MEIVRKSTHINRNCDWYSTNMYDRCLVQIHAKWTIRQKISKRKKKPISGVKSHVKTKLQACLHHFIRRTSQSEGVSTLGWMASWRSGSVVVSYKRCSTSLDPSSEYYLTSRVPPFVFREWPWSMTRKKSFWVNQKVSLLTTYRGPFIRCPISFGAVLIRYHSLPPSYSRTV